ncbi:DUF1993 family protein [Silanimonas sp.]|jgi:hypothetical protein|uniref:DUF1993 family protein n=1 Tax=Silanimonas sp. TaxID=1929290 RepID=UPI0037C84DFF
MHTLTVPALVRTLTQLKHILAKGEAHARAQGWDPAVLLGMRLAPDMFPMTRQVQIATDIAKNSVGRMTGGEAPKFDDSETTFEQLIDRVERTIAYIGSVPVVAFEGAETRDITVPTRARGDLHFKGLDYLFAFILPNVHFHVTTTYALLRHAGVPLGKADYLGPVGMGQG